MRWAHWLILVGIGAALCGCSGGEQKQTADQQPIEPQQVYKWRLVTTWPKNLPALGTAPENLARLVAKMSNDRLQIKVYGANEIVPAFEVFDAVSRGTVEMGHGGAYYWKGKIPVAPFFSSVPFGLTAKEMNGWLHYGGGMELWQELYEPFGLIPIASGNTGVQMAGWFNKEINSLADIQGMKMRIPGLGGEVFQRAGGTAVNLPGGEIFTSLQTGVIDATEWVGPYNDLSFGLYQVAKYYYYPGWHEPGSTLEAIVNKEAFEELPSDLKEILTVATRAVNQDMLDEFTARNNAALRELVDKHQVELRELPADVIRELRTISDEVVAEIAGDDPLAQRIYQSYLQFKENVVSYHEITERAYVNARASSTAGDSR
jgi:TRAP-type mannitol/chloroaromatic compound transport system substrate-binding protein|tara:strand:+ start:3759 stop:4880 length:1122 start_codon:yes stop_codon:yes gene_type:complete